MHDSEKREQGRTQTDVTVQENGPALLGNRPASKDKTNSNVDTTKRPTASVVNDDGDGNHDDSDDDDEDDNDEPQQQMSGVGVVMGRALSGPEARARVGAGAGEPGQPPEAEGNTGIDAADAAERQLQHVPSGPVYSVFSPKMKRYIIAIVTMTSFISPMTANIYFPALEPISKDLGVSVGLINLTVTTYMILQGIAPTLFGDFGDMVGRRPAFLIALVVYLFVNIGLAEQDDYAALMVLRMMQSFGSSGTLALGFAVVADIAVSADRGKYMGVVGAGINVGPAISPVLGGILSQYLGWRAIFWFCTILCGCVLVPYALTVPETSRNVVGNGSIRPPWINMTVIDMVKAARRSHRLHANGADGDSASTSAPPRPKLRFPNPLRTLYIVFEKDLCLLLLLAAALYVVFIMIVATLSPIFADLYGLDDLQIGLCYLPYGVGCFIAAIAQGHILDWNYRRIARRIGFTIDYKRGDDLSSFPIEWARMQPMVPLVFVGLLAVIAYGWVLETAQPLAAPLVLLFGIGLTIVGSFSILNTLIMDLYPQAPATAVAAVNLVRCLCGAGVMAFVDVMLKKMGRGWNFTFWALLCAAFCPIIYVLYRWGPTWREERRVRLAQKKKEKEQQGSSKRKKKKGKKSSEAVASDGPSPPDVEPSSPSPHDTREKSTPS